MTTHEQYGLGDESTVHETVGAYVLGILDDVDASIFEAHLAGCRICAVHLEEFSGMEPMLAMLADNPDPFGSMGPPGSMASVSSINPQAPPPVPLSQLPTPSVSVRPSPQLLDKLVDEVAAKRAKRKRRGFYLVAAAAALIVGGPVAVGVATQGSGGNETSNVATRSTAAQDFGHITNKVGGTDPVTGVSGTVAMEEKLYGTLMTLELKNVKGPLTCSLIAVSKTGEQEVVTTWSVPKWGYGIPDSSNKDARKPLYIQGSTSMTDSEFDHFEVRTDDGKRLLEIDA
ncbi:MULTISPECIES: zf-HC2 domain-containing protein [unclassified Streptomyces]|uniref:anti-sigma factor family protein n=1 Tax=unclassified Streptomyces TaxID=2593676 RepID=UPI002E773DEC|nr:zf-HC2 domain-containing protein [Streptomyces sp. JV176]MEE1802325.1 zf-HC2 domain-containing protein [Streptomyces sp. JV176]